MKDSVFLYGPPGVGKSTTGKILADELRLGFYDLDSEIENRAQKTIPQIFHEEGEEVFRKLERETLISLSDNQPAVFALGGGALLDKQNRIHVEDIGRVVYLGGTYRSLSDRLSKSDLVRPLIADTSKNTLQDLLVQRADHYATFALNCQTDNKSPEEVVREIQKLLGWFYVPGMGDGYTVRVSRGGAGSLGEMLGKMGFRGNVFVVTDENVQPIYAQKILDSLKEKNFAASSLAIPAGEQHKNLAMVTKIWESFLDAGMDRGSIVIALGGGVVGDIAGFAAATFMRGIGWINVPTTLLAMVDASIGGKTGLDLPQGKNLIGAFHAPKLVIADPEVLTTLPEQELHGGMAEVLKHGIIGSPSLYEQCSRGIPKNPGILDQIIREAVSVKVKVIREDPYEKGLREVLNYGHTIGHAVELLSGFEIPHGYAVAIGMVVEAQLSQKIGIASVGFSDEISEILARLKLPTWIPANIDTARMTDVMLKDKKVSHGQIRFSLPEYVGKVRTGVIVDDLAEVLSSITGDN